MLTYPKPALVLLLLAQGSMRSVLSFFTSPYRSSNSNVLIPSRSEEFCRTLCSSRLFENPSTTKNMEQRTISKEEGDRIYESEQIIKKSRFLGIAKHCETWEEAQATVQRIRTEHAKARHICFGVVLTTSDTARFDDDNEPTGTAGAPILNAIQGEKLVDTLCVVVRYFGGVKLGAGGLIRAYGSTARQVLRQATIQTLLPKSTFRVQSSSASNAGPIYDVVSRFHGAIVTDVVYQESGEFQLTVTCDTTDVAQIQQSLLDGTRGNIQWIE